MSLPLVPILRPRVRKLATIDTSAHSGAVELEDGTVVRWSKRYIDIPYWDEETWEPKRDQHWRWSIRADLPEVWVQTNIMSYGPELPEQFFRDVIHHGLRNRLPGVNTRLLYEHRA